MGDEMNRQLIIVPNEILRQKCKPIEEITHYVKELAGDMLEFLSVEHNGLVATGIAAPQLGESVRMFAFRLSPYSEDSSVQVLVNPVLVYGRKSRSMFEMCFSIPGKGFTLQRYEVIKVCGTKLEGNEVSFKVRGIAAQSIQHELNHLDGVLIDELGKEVCDA